MRANTAAGFEAEQESCPSRRAEGKLRNCLWSWHPPVLRYATVEWRRNLL